MSAWFSCTSLLLVSILYSVSFATLREGDKCSLKDGSEGVCKFLKECPTAVELIRTDVNPVVCGFKDIEPIVCCRDDENMTKTINTITTAKRVSRRTQGDISRQKCNEYAEYAYEKTTSPTLLLKPHFTKKLVCDYPRSKLLIGTTKALRRQFPHMALIGYISEPNDEVIWGCGGSLISENFVLTAAHCIFSHAGYPKLVRMGLASKVDSSHLQERTVSDTIVYDKFNYSSSYHDIGLLRLSTNVEFNTYVRPACLQTERYIPYDLAIASGWGIYEYTEDLSEIVYELLNVTKCNSTYYNSRRLQNGLVDDLMICAGSSFGEKDSCTGDVGGPLQVYHEETEEIKCMYDIIGVISFRKACGLKKDMPKVFTRVSGYLKWIEDIVWPN